MNPSGTSSHDFWRRFWRRCVLTLVVWQCVRQAWPIDAYSQDETITVFAAASMTNAFDEIDAGFTKQTGIKVVSAPQRFYLEDKLCIGAWIARRLPLSPNEISQFGVD
jgi:hypothetical protein